MCPQLSFRQKLRSGMSKLYSHCKSWTQHVRRAVCPILCGIGGMKISHSDGKLINGTGTNELPAIKRINKIGIGTNGAIGTMIIIGIGVPPELMMKGGLRGHHGHSRLIQRRRSTSARARLLSGTETSQRRPGEITVEN